jgi:hypothetical protein
METFKISMKNLPKDLSALHEQRACLNGVDNDVKFLADTTPILPGDLAKHGVPLVYLPSFLVLFHQYV